MGYQGKPSVENLKSLSVTPPFSHSPGAAQACSDGETTIYKRNQLKERAPTQWWRRCTHCTLFYISDCFVSIAAASAPLQAHLVIHPDRLIVCARVRLWLTACACFPQKSIIKADGVVCAWRFDERSLDWKVLVCI